MNDYVNDGLADRFEQNRARLRSVAYRMLGSTDEAEDAVQEAWLRLSRSDAAEIDNLSGWLTTVVGRVCLDMLRSRGSRREESWEVHVPDTIEGIEAFGGPEGPGGRGSVDRANPEDEALLADSIGLALLVVLDTLDPAERLAFVLHDMFAVPFDEIAPIVGRSTAAARQLASRARRRVQGVEPDPEADLRRQKEVVDAFLSAARGGDFEALLSVLDPDVVFRADAMAMRMGSTGETRGAKAVAGFYLGKAQAVRPALVDDFMAGVWAEGGRPRIVLEFTIEDDRITAIDVHAEPELLASYDVRFLDGKD
ncbi:sigma-70 family RNA polymerase sigma factor [Streptacidiphilus rugosus]|uniref:sigma-70 family RNA polymerase sigma factor n=1 Tax=Streptacidiphilus rugosus TaxID=405783 RepID=UPI000560A11A|nr:sigma-70 family RNA polymerase sigma factor [Streptacidiphilus rugosus]